jgi:hypothetical protein
MNKKRPGTINEEGRKEGRRDVSLAEGRTASGEVRNNESCVIETIEDDEILHETKLRAGGASDLEDGQGRSLQSASGAGRAGLGGPLRMEEIDQGRHPYE